MPERPASIPQAEWDGMTPAQQQERVFALVEGAVIGSTVAMILVPVLIAATIILVVWLVQRRKAKQGR